MNRFVTLSIFLFLIFSLKAQDRIISTTHDTISCRIVSIDHERILYEVIGKNGSATGKFINLSQVAIYTRSTPTTNYSKLHPQRNKRPINVPEHAWNLRLNVGLSTMPWCWENVQADNTMQDYYNHLNMGYHINTSVIRMITNNLGLGIDASLFNSSFNGNIQSPINTSIYATVSEKFNQYVYFVGPSVLFQQNMDVKRKITVSESVTAGSFFLRFEDRNSYPIVDPSGYTDYTVNTLLTSISFAAKIGLTIDYRLTQNVSVGLGGGLTYGLFKKANLEIRNPNNSLSFKNQELSQPLDMSRIDYSFVVRYQF